MRDTVAGNVLLLEYRGYGESTGTPDEVGLKIDAQTGLDYIRQRADLSDSKIVVYGQSLGGAVAINLVAKNLNHRQQEGKEQGQEDGDGNGGIAALILENTFLSIRKMIPSCVCNLTMITNLGC